MGKPLAPSYVLKTSRGQMLPMLNLGDEKFVRHKLGFAP